MVASSTSEAQDCLDGLDVISRADVLVLEHEPAVDVAGDGCVGVVVRPAREVPVRVRLVAASGETLHQAWAEPWAFVRGCGEGARWAIEASRTVAVEVVVVRAPPRELPACELPRPGVAARAPSLGPEPPRVPTLPALEPPWVADVELDTAGGRRVDLGHTEGCVRVDVVGQVTGGRLHVGDASSELWAAPTGAWAALCSAGTTWVSLEGEGPLRARVSRAPRGLRLGGPEAAGVAATALGATRVVDERQVRLGRGERWRRPIATNDCVRVVVVAADEAVEARYEVRLLAGSALVGRARGGPGRAARVDACEAVTEVEVVQLRGGARLVVGEAVW
ncbi:MAG: hypothetical protein H6721_12825 [Sandaracinus sp.]|nr:hypothetical protein [Sandaracinus sp.]MCB9615454.1 hypothetical protein [Sandaracinus sp.]MCB9622615.1 hypothetical protein [Sandaracinus sp.]MCB9632999.1 hypothetical protein [Sandaracinus sp.]